MMNWNSDAAVAAAVDDDGSVGSGWVVRMRDNVDNDNYLPWRDVRIYNDKIPSVD